MYHVISRLALALLRGVDAAAADAAAACLAPLLGSAGAVLSGGCLNEVRSRRDRARSFETRRRRRGRRRL